MSVSATISERPLNLLCTVATLEMILEAHFIREELLGGLNRPVRTLPFAEAGQVPCMGDALYLVLNEDLAPTVRRTISMGFRNVGVFHMGDEFHSCDRSYYPLVDYVLRNYHHKDLLKLTVGSRCEGVGWVPNGYRTGVGPRNPSTLTPHVLRKDLFFFAGCPTTGGAGLEERREMVEVVSRMKLPGTILLTAGFGMGLGVHAYAAAMERAKFALVPGGRSNETIRLYDALELGAVPITLKHEFLGHEGPMPHAPFVFLDSWRDLPEWFRANSGPNCREPNARQQQDCIEWWSRLKRVYRNQVASLIESSFNKASGGFVTGVSSYVAEGSANPVADRVVEAI